MTLRQREVERRLDRCGRWALALTALLAVLGGPGRAAAATAPAVGDRAPEFEFQGSDGKTYTLQGLLAGGKRGIVLAFFPKAFTPG